MGIMSVSITATAVYCYGGFIVSVPYGDHVCLNDDVVDVYCTKKVSVPYGDHVCLNNILWRIDITK